MKITMNFYRWLLVGAFGIIANVGLAQTNFKMGPSPVLKIEGGSTLHDWHMETSTVSGQGVFTVENGKFVSAKELQISFLAESLKSGTSGLDKNAYKALDTKNNKEIKFSLKSISKSGANFTASGDLTIAGVTKTVSFPVQVTTSGQNFTFKGDFDTKLTTFSIDPPTALLGTVKTDDEITLSFSTTFIPTL
ncbi:YceI family protein [Algoriphagus zhangzhouensis]|nr:YceI family protein [Algoriphagus zhangzhouensis]